MDGCSTDNYRLSVSPESIVWRKRERKEEKGEMVSQSVSQSGGPNSVESLSREGSKYLYVRQSLLSVGQAGEVAVQ